MIALDPGNPAHKLTLAGLYWDTGKEGKAREVLGQLVAADDRQGEDASLRVSGFYLARNRVGEAEQELMTGIRKHQKSIKLRLAVSELYANTNRADDAIRTLKEAAGLSKDQADPDIIAGE